VGLLLLHLTEQGGLSAAHDLVMLGDLLASLLAADVSKHQGGTSSSSSRSWMQAAAGDTPFGSTSSCCLTHAAALKQLQGLSAIQQRVLLFILQCLQLLPVPVAATVAGEVLIRPLSHVLSWEPEVVHCALLVAAVAAEATTATATAAVAAPRTGTAAAATWAGLRTLAAKGRLVGARRRLHMLGFTQLGVGAWQDDCMGSVAAHVASKQTLKQPTVAAATAGSMLGADAKHSGESSTQVQDLSQHGQLAGAAAVMPEAASAAAVESAESARVAVTDSRDAAADDSQVAELRPSTPDTMLCSTPAVTKVGSEQVAIVQAAGGDDSSSPALPTGKEMSTGAGADAIAAADADSSTQDLVVIDPAAATKGSRPTAAQSSRALVDLADIRDPCQRLIEERRRLRGIGMHLQGEVRGLASCTTWLGQQGLIYVVLWWQGTESCWRGRHQTPAASCS
jgi:hypothetical protein